MRSEIYYGDLKLLSSYRSLWHHNYIFFWQFQLHSSAFTLWWTSQGYGRFWVTKYFDKH